MLKINPVVYEHIEKYKASWDQDKIVTIQDLLVVEDADTLNKYLLSVDDSRWQHSIHPYLDNYYTFDNTVDNQHHIEKGKVTANASYQRGEFSYHFRRFEGYEQDGITMKTLLTCAQFRNLIQQITGLSVSSIVSCFASRYDAGNWLHVHVDSGRGSIAFVYNLTKNWKEEYGGNFNLLDDHNWSVVKRVVVPTFNSLTFFDVSSSGRPHLVQRVNDDVTESRIAMSGWLD